MSLAGFSAKLKSHFESFQTSPYLFIGSGLSRRYLRLPTWYDLLEEFTSGLGLPYEFGYYASQVQGNLPKLASVLAEEFHRFWWTSEKYENNRRKYKIEAQIDTQQPFKIELAIFINEKSVQDERFNQEIELLKKVVIDGIITTNWDTFTQELLSDFETFIGQYQLLFTDNASIGEIYKIHGCVSKPNSIIVTEEDYDNFHKKNKFLAAKLFTIFAEHPIVFLGYSISDSNIISILNSIVECVDNHNIDKLRDRLVFVEWVSGIGDPQVLDGHIVIENLPLPIKHVRLDSFIPLFEILSSLKQRLPIKILRKCKKAVYELVKTKNPVNTILVGDLDSVKNEEDIEFVIGVGVANQYSEQGYIGISNSDIFEDVIFENKPWSPEIVIKDVIPKLFKGNIYLPIYKYLRTSGELDDNGNLIDSGTHNVKLVDAVKKKDIRTYYSSSVTYLRKKDYIANKFASIGELEVSFEFRHVLLYIPFLKIENINLDELSNFLRRHYNDTTKTITDFKKIVCLYDYLKFGLQIHFYSGLTTPDGSKVTRVWPGLSAKRVE